MTPKIENLFLSYANTSFRDNPENLLKIYNEITEAISFEGYGKYTVLIDKAIQLIVEFAEIDPETAIEKQAHLIEGDKSFPMVLGRAEWIDFAFEAVFGYLLHDGNYELELSYDRCGNDCIDREKRFRIIGEKRYFGEKRLKCFECDQLYFISILDKISKGIEYSQIQDFDELLKNIRKCVKVSVDIISNSTNNSFEDHLGQEFYLFPDGIYKLIESPFLGEDEIQKLFKSFFYSIFGYSLIGFLIKNDRRKLKHCPFCGQFFIAKSINRKTRCYEPDCEKAYQRDKKRKQREQEPDIYY